MAGSFTTRLGNAPEEGIKAPVVVSTQSNITLSGEQTIETVSVTAGQRVLVRAQTDTTENGIYNAAAGTWTRAHDWNHANDVISGVLVADASNAALYQGIFSGSFVAGTTTVSFTPFNSVTPLTESKTLASAQKNVTFTNAISTGTFYINGVDVDNGRLIEGADYTKAISTKTITLVESYPAGTVVTLVLNDLGGGDSSLNTEYFDASDYISDYTGVTNECSNLQSALDDAVTLGYKRVFMGKSGTINVGNLGILEIPNTIEELFGGSMGGLEILYDDSNSSGGRSDGIRTASGRTADLYLHDFTVRGIRDQNTTTAFGTIGMGIQMGSGGGHLRIERVGATNCRNQAINASGWASLYAVGCRLIDNARGGLSFRNIPNFEVTRCYIEGNGDDCIFDSQTSTSTITTQVVAGTIHHNVIVQSQGIRSQSPKGVSIDHNIIIRPIGFGITALTDYATGDGITSSFATQVKDNVVIDCLNRAELDAYNSSAFYLRVTSPDQTAASGGVISGRPDNTTGLVQRPHEYFWENDSNVSTVGRTGSWYNDVSGNLCMSTLEPGQTFSAMGFPTIYNVADDGASGEREDYLITEAMLNCQGLNCQGQFNGLRIKNNRFVMAKLGAPLVFQNSDADYALMDVEIEGNEFTRSVDDFAIQTAFSTSNKKCKISIRNNTFNGDPWFEATNRSGSGTGGDPYTGAWADTATGAAVDNIRAVGMIIENNEFQNFARLVSSTDTLTRYFKDNVVYCEPAAVGYSASNKGIGNIPSAGPAFSHIIMDCDPTSADYREVVSTPKVGDTAKPTAGTYVQGHWVANETPTVLNDGADYVITGWSRVTTGSGHVAGTDWFEVRGRG